MNIVTEQPADAQNPPRPAPPIGHRVAGGMIWMLLSTLVGRFASLAAQIVLGWVLTKEDFGIYAIALSVSGILAAFRDGSLGQLLIQRGPEYQRWRGPVFWMALLYNLLIAAALVVLAPIAARIYHIHLLRLMIWIIAASILLNTPALVSQAKLAVDLRFRAIANIVAGSTIIRMALTVLLALTGFGPLCFVAPLLAMAVFEDIAGYAVTRDAPWRAPPCLKTWPSLFVTGKWTIAGTVATFIIVSGDYLTVSWLKPAAVLGVYFFAYQLSSQAHALVLGNMQGVLLPSLVTLGDEPKRQRSAFLRSLNSAAVVVFPATIWLAIAAGPLEMLIWRGRWAAAVPVIAILSLTLPFRAVASATKSLLEARGLFRRYFITGILDGAANMLAAGIGCWFGGVRAIAICIAAYMGVSSIWQAWVVKRTIGLPVRTLLSGQIRAWVVSFLSIGVAYCAIRVLGPTLHPFGGLVISSAIYAGICVSVMWLAAPDEVQQFRDAARRLILRRRLSDGQSK